MDIQYTPNYNDLIRTVINASIFRSLEIFGPEAIPVGLFRNKVNCLVYDYTGDTKNVYVRVSKVHEVDENVYVKIQKPL